MAGIGNKWTTCKASYLPTYYLSSHYFIFKSFPLLPLLHWCWCHYNNLVVAFVVLAMLLSRDTYPMKCLYTQKWYSLSTIFVLGLFACVHMCFLGCRHFSWDMHTLVVAHQWTLLPCPQILNTGATSPLVLLLFHSTVVPKHLVMVELKIPVDHPDSNSRTRPSILCTYGDLGIGICCRHLASRHL